MNALTAKNTKSMTSREIADLVGSRHDKVKQAIERLATDNETRKAVISKPPMGDGVKAANGVTEKLYIFTGEQGKRDSIVVVAQLSPEFTARLVDRWQELEERNAMPSIPQTYAEALQLAADQAKQLEEQAPKIEAYNRLAERTGDVNTTIVAKQLGTSARKLNQWMREKGIKWQNADLPMAGYMDWFNVVALDVNGETRSQCLITPKGQIEIAKRWEK